MKTTKSVVDEDWERVHLIDSVYIEQYENELMNEILREENEISVIYGRKERSKLQQVEIKVKRPRFLRRIKRGLPF